MLILFAYILRHRKEHGDTFSVIFSMSDRLRWIQVAHSYTLLEVMANSNLYLIKLKVDSDTIISTY